MFFGIVCVGYFILCAVAVRIVGRALWARQTYGDDLGFGDHIETVMTPSLWGWAGIAIFLIAVGSAS